MLPFLFLLFPTGRLSSRRWRPALWFAIVSLELLLVGTVVFATSVWNEPFTLADTARSGGSFALTLFVVVLFLQPIAAGVSFVSVAIRYRGSVGDERIQLKWFVTAALFVLLTFTATLVTNLPVAQISFDLALGVPLRGHRHRDPEASALRHRRHHQQGGCLRDPRRVHHDRVRGDRRRGRHVHRHHEVPVVVATAIVAIRSNRRAIAQSGPRTA